MFKLNALPGDGTHLSAVTSAPVAQFIPAEAQSDQRWADF